MRQIGTGMAQSVAIKHDTRLPQSIPLERNQSKDILLSFAQGCRSLGGQVDLNVAVRGRSTLVPL
jgi:hypothetical protein